MKKITIQGLMIIASFFLTFFLLQQTNWMRLFSIKENTAKTEEKLGNIFWEVYKQAEPQNNNKIADKVINNLVNQICKNNNIETSNIKVHLVKKDDINAFALPNGHLVVYTGLIAACENQEELAGVIAHEIAHIESKHVMKKLIKEIGLTVLISMTTGNTSSEAIKSAIKLLSSSAFDRKLEKEADIKAVDYLTNAKINTTPFANFLNKLGNKDNSATKYLSWLSTHPESEKRAEYISAYSKSKKIKFQVPLGITIWKALQKSLNN